MTDKATAKTEPSRTDTKRAAPAPPPPNINGPVMQASFLRFTSNAVQIFGKQLQDDTLKAGEANGKRWEIDFIPGMRHWRITCHDTRAGGNKEPVVDFIHETQVRGWRPA
jgi:hypothetical protein